LKKIGKKGSLNAILRKYAKRYFIDAMGAMASGLFASLLIGTIIKTLGQQLANIEVLSEFAQMLVDIGTFASAADGCAMAIAIGYALKAHPLVLFSLAAVGYATDSLGGAGGPLAVLIVAIVASEIGMLVSKKTKVDILVTPFVTIFIGCALAMLVAKPIGDGAQALGQIIRWATYQQPFIMGVVISVVMGMILTLPISSAAICAALSLTGLAGGAALAGCCAQMIGFAVISFSDNGIGGLISQGLGTSMLKIGNITKKPLIWIAPTITSAILGPVSTVILGMTNNALGAGMGTSGLVGPLAAYATMSSTTDSTLLISEIVGLYFIAPAIICYLIHLFMVKRGWIKPGDFKLA
jgi:uncharacterized membrane protein